MGRDDIRLDALTRELWRLQGRVTALETALADLDVARAGRVSPATLSVEMAPAQPLPPPAPALRPSRLGTAETADPWATSVAPVAAAFGRLPAAGPGPSRVLAPPAAPQTGWQVRAEPTPSRPPISLRDLEERFAGRALAWVGGLALVAAAVFFLSLAFSRGWVTEPMRVVIGLVGGVAAFGGGTTFLVRGGRLMGNVLTAVGIGIISVALFAATRLYSLVPPEAGLAGALLVAVAAAVIAVRLDVREVAALGLVAALVAPPVVGASPTLLTLGFVAVTLVGTTAIALFRSWRWLPPIAFVLAAPQLASWLMGEAVEGQALVALAGFWLVNVVAAAGEEVRVQRDDLRPSSATLVLANGTFLLWGGFVTLHGDLEMWRGVFLASASAAHLLLGAWFLRRQGLEHLFGNLVAGTGVALLTIAAFVQLGAPAVPLAWALEAAALAWLAVRRRHRWSAVAATALGTLVVGHLLLLEYPFWWFGLPSGQGFETPFLHAEAGSLGAVVLALAAAIVVVPVRWIRSSLLALGVLLAVHAVTFELRGPWLAAALVGLALAGLALDRVVAALPHDASRDPVAGAWRRAWAGSVAAALAGSAAVALLFTSEFPVHVMGGVGVVPFWPRMLSLVAVLAGLAAAGTLLPVRWLRSTLAAVAVVVLAWAAVVEMTGPALVGALAVLLPAGAVAARGLERFADRDPFEGALPALRLDQAVAVAGAGGWALASCITLTIGNPAVSPYEWPGHPLPGIPFTDPETLVTALLAGAAIAAARWLPAAAARSAGMGLAIAWAAILVPLEVDVAWTVVFWVGLGTLAALIGGVAQADAPRARGGWMWLAAAIVSAALLAAFAIVAPPYRLWEVDPVGTGYGPLLAAWPLAFAVIAVASYAASRRAVAERTRALLALGAGASAVYLASVAVVDLFARQGGGGLATEELAKQAQVALSVCWTAIGSVALGAGLVRRHPFLRHAGLGLLGLATAKVFLIDLAAMDVAYRALVLAGLGLLLLCSAWLFTHFRVPHVGTHGPGQGPTAAA